MNFIDACALYRKKLWEEVGGYDEQVICVGWEDWDFWLRVTCHGGAFVHLSQIAFDYRVRKDSVIVKLIGFDYRGRNLDVKMSARAAELLNYIFNKPEMACYKLLRETDEEVQQLRGGIRTIQNSPSYRLGHGLLAPARLLRKWWRGF